MRARKLFALMLVGGLVVGSVGVAEAKKKKKKKPKLVSETAVFFLRNTSECETSLSLVDGEDSDCFAAENAAGSVAGYVESVYPAADGLPFKLDATAPLTGTITIRNGNSAGAGVAGVVLTLAGETGGEEAVIATWESESFTIVPGGAQTLEYEAEIDPALDKKKFTSLSLTVTPTGTTVGFYGTVEHDGPPPSLVNVPVLVKK